LWVLYNANEDTYKGHLPNDTCRWYNHTHVCNNHV